MAKILYRCEWVDCQARYVGDSHSSFEWQVDEDALNTVYGEEPIRCAACEGIMERVKP